MIIDNPKLKNLKTVHNIDRVHHPDSEMIYNFGKYVKLGDLRKICELEEYRRNMTVIWDDVVQYTSLGLLDLLYDIHDIEFPIPFKEFFERKTFGNRFVKDTVKMFGIPEDEVDFVEREGYSEILMRSPLSKNAEALLMLRRMLRAQLFVFKYNVPGINRITEDIRNSYESITKEYVSSEIDFTNGKTEKEYWSKFPKNKYKYLEIVAAQDAGSIIDKIRDEVIDVGANILTVPHHNGISNDELFAIASNSEGYGRGDYIVKIMKEV
jgi:hypothetical protein